MGTGNALIAGLHGDYTTQAHEWAVRLRDDIVRRSPQLFCQLFTLVSAVESIIRVVPNYYAQRSPRELAQFAWFVDPKDLKRTPYEDAWGRVVFPLLQQRSLEQPSARVQGFDYSAFDRFCGPMPEYLIPHLKEPRDAQRRSIDLRLLLRDVSYPDSQDDAGVQLADVVASAFTKAMNGLLPRKCWRLLGRLMVEKPGGAVPVDILALGEGDARAIDDNHAEVLRELRTSSKPMIRYS